MVMFDSLNRRMLSPYGCDWTKTPNFARLAENAVTFDTCFCREHALHAGKAGAAYGTIQFFTQKLGPDGTL